MNEVNIFSDESFQVIKNAQEVFFQIGDEKNKLTKEYFAPIKVKSEENIVYILNTDESKLDIYDKNTSKLIRSIGKKQYFKDQIHEFIYRYFMDGKIVEFFKNPVFFFPNDFFITKDEIMIWDTRNYMIKCIDKESYKLERFCFIDNDVYDVDLKEGKLVFNGVKSKEIGNIDWIMTEKIKDRLDEILQSQRIEDLDDTMKIFHEKIKDMQDLSEISINKRGLLNNIAKNYIMNDSFNKNSHLELKRTFPVVKKCKDFCYNENDEEFLFIPSDKKIKEKLYFYKNDGTILSVCDDKVMKDLSCCTFFKNNYYLLDKKENNIIKIGADNKFELVMKCLSESDGDYRSFTKDSEYLYSYDHKENVLVKIDVEADVIIEKIPVSANKAGGIRNVLPGNEMFVVAYDDKKGLIKNSLYLGDENIYSDFNLKSPVKIDDDLIMVFSRSTYELLFFSISQKKLVHKELIHLSVKDYAYSAKRERLFAYNYVTGMMFEYSVDTKLK